MNCRTGGRFHGNVPVPSFPRRATNPRPQPRGWEVYRPWGLTSFDVLLTLPGSDDPRCDDPRCGDVGPAGGSVVALTVACPSLARRAGLSIIESPGKWKA